MENPLYIESLRLYIAHPLMGCWLIHQGLPTYTTCAFVVPDTQSNKAFRFWVAVEGCLRYDSIVSPPFYIKRRTGIGETSVPTSAFRIPHLEVYPNPFTEKTEIRFTIHDTRYKIQDARYRIGENGVTSSQYSVASLRIYDVVGRVVRKFNHLTNYQSLIMWDGTDDSGCTLPPGVYFVCLNWFRSLLVKKIVKTE